MARICEIDSRHHRQELTPARYQAWASHMAKQGYTNLWLVAREEGRLIAHVWAVVKDKKATVLVVMACAYATPKVQVAAMLLEAEEILAEHGADAVGYLDSEHEYNDVFDALEYERTSDPAKIPGGFYFQPKSITGERAALRWRTIAAEPQDQRAVCLDRNWSTQRLLPHAALPDSSSTP